MNVEKGMTLMKTYIEEEDDDLIVKGFEEGMDAQDKLEFMNVVEKMLFFGPTSSMKKFVRVLLDRMDGLPTNLRCRMLENVHEADDPDYIRKMRSWIGNNDLEIACRIHWLKQLSYYTLYEDDQHVGDWIGNIFIHIVDAFHRNRVVMDLFHTYEDNERFGVFVQIMREYKKIFDDPIMYRVVFAQNIIKKDNLDDDTFIPECLDDLIRVMTDDTYSFEAQADICDFFLNTENSYITQEHHEQAERKMRELFQENMVSHLSVYANRQNVHSDSIEKSSQEILEKLHEKYGLRPTTFEQLQQWRLEMEGWTVYPQEEDLQQKIVLCMNRIFFDKRLYGSTKDTLCTIFGLVWRHIHHSTHEDELKIRLLEEMSDASGQCSTGIAVRLLNTLSGYDDFMLKISYKEAILSRVMHHMNKKIQSIGDSILQETLLHEMIVPPSQYTDRKNFLEFFRKNIAIIKEELYPEYSEFVSDTDFDLYLKQALIVYEGGVH